jgi:TetR/AcrR family acrAB operon transcriptional repressor
MRKTQEDTEISKNRILLAAEDEFRARGYTGANIDNIARKAGMTKGAIFWHYKSKAGLFEAIVKRATVRVKRNFTETLSTVSTARPRRIMEEFREIIKKVKKDRAFDVLLVMNELAQAGDLPKSIFAECKRDILRIFRDAIEILADAQKRGELRPGVDVRNILVTITLIMSGFAKINEVRSFIPMAGLKIDDEAVINAMFDGLLSFQKGESREKK